MDILKPSRKLKGWIMYTVEPPLTGTFPQRPPLYNGHFLLSVRWPLWRGLTVLSRTCLMGHSALLE